MAPLNPHHGNQTHFTVGAARKYFLFIFAAIIVLFYIEFRQSETICNESAANRTAIRDSLIRGFTNLGYRWDEEEQKPVQVAPPTISYYKEHPEEIAIQLDRLRQELDGFPPIECGEYF